MSKFTPKQSVPPSITVMEEVQGDVSAQIAQHTLTLIPFIGQGAVLLDNACGTGAVTEAVLTVVKPRADGTYSILIHATDVSPSRIQGLATKVAQNGWSDFVKSAVIAAEALTFEDSTFTHSFMNFGLFAVREADKATAQIYRTLKPGGVVVVTTWASMPHGAAVDATHKATRGSDAALLLRIPEHWYRASTLESVLRQAGFTHVEMSQKEAYLKIKDVHRWVVYAWSLLGEPESRWQPKDENDWDTAISILEEQLKNLKEYESIGEGGARIRMLSNIAVAVK